MVENKRYCYYKSRACDADQLMLREFVDFCDKEAVKEVWLAGNSIKKTRVICNSLKCYERAWDDLNKLKTRVEEKRKLRRRINRLEKLGYSKEEILKDEGPLFFSYLPKM